MYEHHLAPPVALAASLARDPRVRLIRHYVQRQPETVRRELPKRANWCFGHYTWEEQRCLVSHVADVRVQLGLPQEETDSQVPLAFDELAEELGLRAVVALVQQACGALK